MRIIGCQLTGRKWSEEERMKTKKSITNIKQNKMKTEETNIVNLTQDKAIKLVIPFDRDKGGKGESIKIDKTKELLSFTFFTLAVVFTNDNKAALSITVYDDNIIKDIAKVWNDRQIYIV